MDESKARPKTAKDKALSNKHVRETMNLQKRHLREHVSAKTRPGYSKTYNISHAKAHAKSVAKRRAKLAGRRT